MNVGDLVQLRMGHPYMGLIGVIIEKTLEVLPPASRNNKVLVYKVLLAGIIINVPLKWMVRINTHPSSQEK